MQAERLNPNDYKAGRGAQLVRSPDLRKPPGKVSTASARIVTCAAATNAGVHVGTCEAMPEPTCHESMAASQCSRFRMHAATGLQVARFWS